ncbi:sphingomyelin phosphodiesterase 4-like [Anopheles bellator]|uniref:sphingomyelin phosphodiesterase 4-like n=1 Tax=Anopheles bellator TaxID=139047 RepID=UPI00264913B8|nr:sphingomyelin phosphodiesterase 4-like [Anopheles bellator]
MFLLPGNGAHDTSSQRTPGTAEIYQYGHWRSRSVMFILLDMWLRLDVNPVLCHPDPLSCTLSIELLTNIRALVKQIHKFSSINTDLDYPPIRQLRSEAQRQLKERIEPFLWQLICHWPPDESLKELLEVWLSYIQPWRYGTYRDSKQLTQFQTMFIADNISAYTQPLVHLLLRFSKYDPAHPSFWRPLHRVCTVFNQYDLAKIIRSYDKIESEKSQLENYTTLYGTHYYSMFSDSSQEMELLMDQLGSRIKFLRHMLTFGNHYDSWSNQLLHFVYKLLQLYTFDQQEMLLLHSRLEFIYNVLTEKLNAPARQGLLNDSKNKPRTARNGFWIPGFFGNPDLIPVTSAENATLVRTFHRLSEKLNIMLESKLYVIWLSETVWCALVRQLLEPPVTFYTYVRNAKRQREKQQIYLGPRISFRFLASYRNIAYVLLAIVLGVLLYGSPFFGLQILMLLSFIRIVLRAIFFPQ